MRVLIATGEREAAGWLQVVLSSAGLQVVLLGRASSSAPELNGADLLVADRDAADAIGEAGPGRRMLLVPRGAVVDLAQALAGGFIDLLVVPSPEDEILSRVGRALDRFLKPAKASAGARAQANELKTIVERVVGTLRRTGPDRVRATHELAEGMLSVFLLMIDAHETSERGTPGHSKRVGSIVRCVAQRLGRTDSETGWLELAGRLHDLGLVSLQAPLKTSAPLSPELRRMLTEHPRLAQEILQPLEAWGLPVMAIRWHHERLDGSGYPDGLQGDDLPQDAQILGAADAFEALTSSRPWRGAESPAEALGAIRTMHGFREAVVNALEVSAEEGGIVQLRATPVLRLAEL